MIFLRTSIALFLFLATGASLLFQGCNQGGNLSPDNLVNDEKTGAASGFCECVNYVWRNGFEIWGHAKDWDNNASQYGYRVVSQPVIGGAMNFEQGAFGVDPIYGHVAKVVAYSGFWSGGKLYFNIRVRHANMGGRENECGCNNISTGSYTVAADEKSVHYITKKK